MAIVAIPRHCAIKGNKPYYNPKTGLWCFARMTGLSWVTGDATAGTVELPIYPGPAQPIVSVVPENVFWWDIEYLGVRCGVSTCKVLYEATTQELALLLGGVNTPGYFSHEELGSSTLADGYYHRQADYSRAPVSWDNWLPYCALTAGGDKGSMLRSIFATNTDTKYYEVVLVGRMYQSLPWLIEHQVVKVGGIPIVNIDAESIRGFVR